MGRTGKSWPRARALGRVVVGAAAALTVLTGPGVATAADTATSSATPSGSAAEARRHAGEAARRVATLQAQVEAALHDYEVTMRGFSASVARSVGADAAADAADLGDRMEREAHAASVRALYMTGGSAGLMSGVLNYGGKGEPQQLLRRADDVQRFLSAHAEVVSERSTTSGRLRRQAGELERGLSATVVTASQVTVRWRRLDTVLAIAETELGRLRSSAAALEEAERVAAALDAARQRAERAALEEAARAVPRLAPAAYQRLYVSAAGTCPGLSWTVLSAIGQVESGHGRNNGPSPAGALGPMQFLPSTFARYGLDGDGDGDREVWDPADAVFSAARYLCANGAGRPGGLPGAIWRYNHADWYVELVLHIAERLATRPPGP